MYIRITQHSRCTYNHISSFYFPLRFRQALYAVAILQGGGLRTGIWVNMRITEFQKRKQVGTSFAIEHIGGKTQEKLATIPMTAEVAELVDFFIRRIRPLLKSSRTSKGRNRVFSGVTPSTWIKVEDVFGMDELQIRKLVNSTRQYYTSLTFLMEERGELNPGQVRAATNLRRHSMQTAERDYDNRNMVHRDMAAYHLLRQGAKKISSSPECPTPKR